MSDIAWSDAHQGSPEWLDVRRGRITASMFRTAIDTTAKGMPTSVALRYAMDTARERCGGKPAEVFATAAMRFGTEQEPLARMAYEDKTGSMVEQVGFAYTTEAMFGCSVDGLVDDDGMIEIKTMVSSDTLFSAVVERDYSQYIDQINGCLWLLHRKWCDLCLWAPDLPTHKLTIVRITRDEDAIELLAERLLAAERRVSDYERALRAAIELPSSLNTRAQAEVAAPVF